MTYVEVGMERWHTGKRKKKYYTKPFDISDGLWYALEKFANEDELSYVGVYDWENGLLRIPRTEGLDNVFKQYCNAPKDYELFSEVEKESFGANITITPMKFKYEYSKEVQSVDLENKTCTVLKQPSRAEFENSVGIPEWKPYTVPISDMCVFQEIKKKDVVLIRKFLDDTHMAVKVLESYKEPTKEEIERRRKEFNDLFGDY